MLATKIPATANHTNVARPIPAPLHLNTRKDSDGSNGMKVYGTNGAGVPPSPKVVSI
jgi:hypothetical protein